MKGMKDAQEYSQAAPPGLYPARIVAADATVSKKGDSMIHLTAEIIAPSPYAGQQADDYLGTDGTTKFGGVSKGRLRGLGLNVDSNDEIPDAVIAQQLLGRVYNIEFGNEARMKPSVEGGPFDTVLTAVDSRTGQTIQLQKLTIKNYHVPNAQPQQLPPQQQAPQYQQPQQQYAPQPLPQQQLGIALGGAPGFPPGLPLQQAPQYAPQPVAPQYAQAPFQQPGMTQQFAPQQQLQPQYQQAPAQGQPMQAQQPWAPPANGAQAPVAPAEPKKRGRKAAGEAEAEG